MPRPLAASTDEAGAGGGGQAGGGAAGEAGGGGVGGGRRFTPRAAASREELKKAKWESKWKDMEADLQDVVEDDCDAPGAGLTMRTQSSTACGSLPNSSKWETMELDMLETLRSDARSASSGSTPTSGAAMPCFPRSPSSPGEAPPLRGPVVDADAADHKLRDHRPPRKSDLKARRGRAAAADAMSPGSPRGGDALGACPSSSSTALPPASAPAAAVTGAAAERAAVAAALVEAEADKVIGPVDVAVGEADEHASSGSSDEEDGRRRVRTQGDLDCRITIDAGSRDDALGGGSRDVALDEFEEAEDDDEDGSGAAARAGVAAAAECTLHFTYDADAADAVGGRRIEQEDVQVSPFASPSAASRREVAAPVSWEDLLACGPAPQNEAAAHGHADSGGSAAASAHRPAAPRGKGTANIVFDLDAEAPEPQWHIPVSRPEDEAEEASGRCREKESGAMLPEVQPMKGLRSMWRLWSALVGLSIVELLLIAAGSLLDVEPGSPPWLAAIGLGSPCRRPLPTCFSLHEADCAGASCQALSPLWALAWPLCGLLFIAGPLRSVLRSAGASSISQPPRSASAVAQTGRGGKGRDAGAPVAVAAPAGRGRCGERRPRAMLLVLPFALATVGTGAMALAQLSVAGVHYAARCPMERSIGRCSSEVCPSPVCRRETEFSPCVCGRVEEEEMARALFLNHLPACQPYEWYAWQMQRLEELVLSYENFACLAGPLMCAAVAVGAALLLAQLASCPLLLLGRFGVRRALLVLLASDEELDRAMLPDASAAAAAVGPRWRSSSEAKTGAWRPGKLEGVAEASGAEDEEEPPAAGRPAAPPAGAASKRGEAAAASEAEGSVEAAEREVSRLLEAVETPELPASASASRGPPASRHSGRPPGPPSPLAAAPQSAAAAAQATAAALPEALRHCGRQWRGEARGPSALRL